jgi:hypothetical protein
VTTFFRRSIRSTAVPRFFTVLILASLILSVAPVLSTPGVVAQDGEGSAPATQVQESEAPAPLPEEQPAGEPTPTPPPEETTSPDADPENQGGGVASFIAEVRGCPPGFDLAAGDASAALSGCTEPLAGIAFTLATQHPNDPGDTRTTSGDGIAAWRDIPLGTGYSVTEAVPQGTGDPWVYCEVTGGPGADQYSFFPASGGRMDVGLSDPNLANYTQAYCRWFNVLPDDATLVDNAIDGATASGEVRITNYRCPVNYNTADMTLGTLKAACTTAGDGFWFLLKASRGTAQSKVTDAQGVAVWTQVPAGKLTITETLPAPVAGPVRWEEDQRRSPGRTNAPLRAL